MNATLFGHTIGSQRVRLIACGLGLLAWGAVLPLVYSSFGRQLGETLKSNPFLSQFANFGGADVISLSGSIALGFIHPFTLLLMSIIAVGLPVTAIAGERQRGTLEVVLSRPLSRHA